VVTGAVVATLAVTDWAPPPLNCTEELDKPHVGAGVTAGVTAQLTLTVPVNDPVGAMVKSKLAVCLGWEKLWTLRRRSSARSCLAGLPFR
jgi:hypothetical protein